VTRAADAPLLAQNLMANSSQAPDSARKAPFYCIGCGSDSPIEQQTGAYRVMHLSNNLLSQYGNHCNQASMKSSPPVPSSFPNTVGYFTVKIAVLPCRIMAKFFLAV